MDEGQAALELEHMRMVLSAVKELCECALDRLATGGGLPNEVPVEVEDDLPGTVV